MKRFDSDGNVKRRATAPAVRVEDLAALLSLPAGATAETVLERIREGERARRAWEWAREHGISMSRTRTNTTESGVTDGWSISRMNGRPTTRNDGGPLAAVLAAMDAQGVKP